jgi:uncharacterized protein YqgC (DUF456 family)
MEILPLIIAMIFFALGIVGIFVPMLPEASLVWLGMLIYGLLTEFENLPVWFYVLQALVALLVMGTDYVATAVGTKKFHGSKASVIGATLGLFMGVIILPPFGIIIGPFLGALLGELLQGSSLEKSVHVSIGSLIGVIGGIFVKLIIVVAMIVWFIIQIC